MVFLEKGGTLNYHLTKKYKVIDPDWVVQPELLGRLLPIYITMRKFEQTNIMAILH